MAEHVFVPHDLEELERRAEEQDRILSNGLRGVIRELKLIAADPDALEQMQMDLKASIGYLRNALLDQYFFYVCISEGDASERTMMEAFMADKQALKDLG